jgi:hypothetical protein
MADQPDQPDLDEIVATTMIMATQGVVRMTRMCLSDPDDYLAITASLPSVERIAAHEASLSVLPVDDGGFDRAELIARLRALADYVEALPDAQRQ